MFVLLGVGSVVLAFVAVGVGLLGLERKRQAERREKKLEIRAIIDAEEARLLKLITGEYGSAGAESTDGGLPLDLRYYRLVEGSAGQHLVYLDIELQGDTVMITAHNGTLDSEWARAFEKALTAKGIPAVIVGVALPPPSTSPPQPPTD